MKPHPSIHLQLIRQLGRISTAMTLVLLFTMLASLASGVTHAESVAEITPETDSTVEAIQSETTPEPTESLPTETPEIYASVQPVQTEAVTAKTSPLPSSVTVFPTVEEVAVVEEPVLETSTPQPTATQQATATPTPEVNTSAVEGTFVKVTVKLGDHFGPPIQYACFTLLAGSLEMWAASGCTGANGVVLLEPFGPITGASVLDVSDPPGYHLDEDRIPVTIVPGRTIEYIVTAQPVPPTDMAFHAINRSTEDPVPGACWSLYAVQSYQPTDLILGPLCDQDNDGTVLADDVPTGPYCYRVLPPTGFVLTGQIDVCNITNTSVPEVTRAFLPIGQGEDPGAGKLSITTKTTWGTPLAGVCITLTQETQGGVPFDVANGCTGSDGKVVFSDMADGTYVVAGSEVPLNFGVFSTSATIQAPAGASLEIVVDSVRFGSFDLTAKLGRGPDLLGGACWRYKTNEGDIPGEVTVVGPVCDTDGDGKTILEETPYGAFCLVAEPPAGYYRPNDDYYACAEKFEKGGSWSVSFIPVPKTPTPQPTGSPTATPTPSPTKSPVPNEPKGNVTVRNCQFTQLNGLNRTYSYCATAPAGVKFALIQGGTQVGTVTTSAGGALNLDLPARATYQLTYIEGNNGYAPGPGETARLRYNAQEPYTFMPNPAITQWTMTVKTRLNSYYNRGAIVAGACYRIIDSDGNQVLPEACDTDNDGDVTVGTLPVSFNGELTSYRAVMTVAPPGQEIPGPNIGYGYGVTSVDTPGQWIATVQFDDVVVTVRTVDQDGNLVPGFGYAMYKTGDGLADGRYDIDDGFNDGVTAFGQRKPGDEIHVEPRYQAPGYLTDLTEQIITIGSNPRQTVTFVARSYGSEVEDKAVVRFIFTDQFGKDWNEAYQVCVSLSPNSGVPNDRQVCPSRPGYDVVFRNVPIGTYRPVLSSTSFYNSIRTCSVSLTNQPTFTVTADELGTTITVPIIATCPVPPSSSNCFVDVNDSSVTDRSIDIYYGSYIDLSSNDVTSLPIQLSESLSSYAADQLLAQSGLDPDRINASTLEPWVQGFNTLTEWASQPDWDGNAGYALSASYLGLDPDAVVGNRQLLQTIHFEAGVETQFYFLFPGDPMLDEYPQCADDTESLFITITRYATVNIYQMDATSPVDAGPTPWPSPEAMCTSTSFRGLTIAYGEVIDPETGAAIYQGLQLSDRIPAEIAAAIKRGDAPDIVKALIDDWVDPDLDAGSWPFTIPSDIDVEAALRAQFAEQGYEIELPDSGDESNKSYTADIYRWVNNADLPEGCIVTAELGDLYPITQETTADVAFIELNANVVRGSEPNPTATPDAGEPVTTLPNTGAQSGRSESNDFWWLLVLLICATGAFAVRGAKRTRLTK